MKWMLCWMLVLALQVKTFAALPSTVAEAGTLCVVLGAEPSATEFYAAGELLRVLRRMTGGEPSLIHEPAPVPADRPVIVIGTPVSSKAIAGQPVILERLRQAQHGGQSYVMLTRDGRLFLAGGGPAGALYATYDLLERLGARWLWPGETGEFLPATDRIELPELDVTESPAFALRGFRGRYRREGGIWMARNRLNYGDRDLWRYEDLAYTIGFPRHWGGHSFGWIAPEDCSPVKRDRAKGVESKLARQVYFEKYPEHFSLIKGARVLRQHCYANPEVQSVFIDWIKRFWRDNPDVEVLSLSPMDNSGFCECERCTRFGKDVSTRLHKFLKIVIDEVEKDFPGKKYRVFAYSVYKNAPKTPVHPALTIEYCMHDRCYKHLLDDPDCERNHTAVARLQPWLDLGIERMTMYGYHYDAVRGTHSGFLMPLVPVLQDELQYLDDQGFSGFASEMAGRPGIYEFSPSNIWAANQIGVYLTSRLLWNPQADVARVLLDVCKTAYGAAGHPMADYERLMWRAWMGEGHLSGYFSNPARIADQFLTHDIIRKADELLKTAAQALEAAPPHPMAERHRRNLALAREVYMTWRDLAVERFGWMSIATNGTPERVPKLQTAPIDELLYRADFDTVRLGDTPPGFSDGCEVLANTEGDRFVRIGDMPGDRLIFGNHPRFFENPANWINYETSFKFRFTQPDQGTKHFTLLTRTGGIRFNDDFRTIYVTIGPNRITVAVRDRSGKPHPVANGSIRLEGAPLAPRQWHGLRIRNVDQRLFVWLRPSHADNEMLVAHLPIPLGGGYVNLRNAGGLDISPPQVHAVVNTPEDL